MESNNRGYSVGGASEMMAMLDNSSNSLWAPSSSPSFHESMVNFNHDRRQERRAVMKRDHSGGDADTDTGGEEFETNPYHQAEKKRRLTQEQVLFLGKSFEVENKLEPERKVELAKELGLQPRQVAIWFQNRRARYKTKQLEKDYDSLKSSYDRLKLDYDSLFQEKDALQAEINTLTKKLKQRDEGIDNTSTENLCHMDNNYTMPKLENQMLAKTESMAVPHGARNQLLVEDANSAKSDVVDSDSPHCADGNHYSSLFEDPTDQQSDHSQGGEEEHLMLSKKLLLPPTPPPTLLAYNNFLKVEDNSDGCYDDLNASSCNFSLVDDQPFLSWLC